MSEVQHDEPEISDHTETKAPTAMDLAIRALAATHIDGIGSEVVSSNYREGAHEVDSYNVTRTDVEVAPSTAPVTAPVTSAKPQVIVELPPLHVPAPQASDREKVAAS